jgi:aminopeptidase N
LEDLATEAAKPLLLRASAAACLLPRPGNRVTCRDWFQLTLKEGLTVFRDQGFSADMNSAPVKRIEVGLMPWLLWR